MWRVASQDVSLHKRKKKEARKGLNLFVACFVVAFSFLFFIYLTYHQLFGPPYDLDPVRPQLTVHSMYVLDIIVRR